MKHLLSLGVLFLFLICGNAQRKLIHAGAILDVKSKKILREQSIHIENERIMRIQNGYVSPNEGEVLIDLKDAYLLPGLIDMHVHLETTYTKSAYLEKFTKNPTDLAIDAYANGKTTLLAGFTTVRDLGGSGANVSLRNAINRGLVEGPRVYTARKSIAITGGHADPSNGGKLLFQTETGPEDGVCNGPAECAEAVRWQIKNGADLIKITATGGVLSVAKDGDGPAFSEEELQAILSTAKDRGVHVAAHAHGKEGMIRAIEAGVLTIEHGTYMDEEVFGLMKKHNAYLVPTITAGMGVADSAKIDGYFPEIVRPKAAKIGAQIIKTFEKAHKNGVQIAFGTDAGVFQHGKNALEFVYMTQAGMSAWESIQSATLTNAKLLKAENDLGQIQTGFLADIIAVRQNPIEQIETLQNVVFVMKNGKVYKQ